MRSISSTISVGILALLGSLLLSVTSASAQGQAPPPIQGVTGTIATDGTIESEHRAGKAIAQGAAKVVDGAKKILPGGKSTNENPLDDFAEGSRVVLRDVKTVDGEAATATEGVVIDVNKKRNQITVRLSDKKTQTLKLATPDTPADVVVSYTGTSGARIAHDFNRVS